ncbi:hypothetical protein TWF102_003413 [Orbilia oligospora]|uniref:F-box domain-containing protein n=1 Tax=Orbilia oligospora TaxID=2813651 RepID=A0A7C8JHB2_ORBOL|nr:hypothetical protein TWF102_003413 [Orbilia oligospora]KAF3104704.1 hypothetical protein TWF706_004486 [Orbilia oligospora]KAF3115399.1 hypothetical protein TWF103_010826 [Orbilia oligospora]KAF3139725.1 hypothetical protein TWF594_006586 [Orbilia oligospora]
MDTRRIFPFLHLPRELRDQIYTCLLYFPPPPVPTPTGTISRRLRANKSHHADLPEYEVYPHLLQVNKQIHDEGALVLYGRNTFLIQITTDCSTGDRRIRRPKVDTYNAILSSPWEIVGYTCPNVKTKRKGKKVIIERPVGKYCDARHYRCGNSRGRIDNYYGPRPSTWDCVCYRCARSIPKSKNGNFPFLAPTYRHLIRHVRIDLFDVRIARSRLLHRGGTLQTNDDRIRRILLPFSYRLRELLEPAGGGLEVEITAIPVDPIRNEEWELKTPTMYLEILETIWPLTLGPWRYKITMSDHTIEQFGDISTEEIMESCTEMTNVTAEEEKQYREVKVEGDFCWIHSRGVYLAQNKERHRYGRCANKREMEIADRWYHRLVLWEIIAGNAKMIRYALFRR